MELNKKVCEKCRGEMIGAFANCWRWTESDDKMWEEGYLHCVYAGPFYKLDKIPDHLCPYKFEHLVMGNKK